MSWRTPRERVSVLAALAIHKETVARRLAELRAQHDLSQEKAAGQVGVTVRQWQRWENGVSIPYPRNLGAIADKFGFDVAEFYDAAPEPRPGRAPVIQADAAQLDRIEQKLDDILAKLAANELAEVGAGRTPPRTRRPRPARQPTPRKGQPARTGTGEPGQPADG